MTDPAPPRPTPSIAALADQCVQCGLCLPTCPTYALEPIEAESPRGRIALAKAWDSGALDPTETGERHLDQCLGCRRCEAVCPAGVRYGALLTAARTQQRRRRPPDRRQRAVEWLSARPGPLGLLLGAYRLAWPLLPTGLRPLPRPPAASDANTYDTAATATTTVTATVFVGCVADRYESPARAALGRLCAAAGVALRETSGQTCCGALHAHAGDAATAAALAARNRSAFAGGDTVLTIASGCHEAIADALRESVPSDSRLHDSRVVDAFDFLLARSDRLRFRPRAERIALHLPCTQRNVTKSDAALRALLSRVPALDVVALDSGPEPFGYGCCGAAGTQMLTDPARAATFRQPLLDRLAAVEASRLLSANIGCRLHLANGTALPVQHPLEFLAECLA